MQTVFTKELSLLLSHPTLSFSPLSAFLPSLATILNTNKIQEY